jgi:glutaredoxin 3
MRECKSIGAVVFLRLMLKPLRDVVTMARIEIYTTRFCGYCRSAKALLTRKGVEFSEIDVTGDPEGRSRMIERANGSMTVPQIFIGATHVGGCDDLYDLERTGQLDPLLKMNDEATSSEAASSEAASSEAAPAGPAPESPAA